MKQNRAQSCGDDESSRGQCAGAEPGFTLIEVLVSLAILSIGIVLVLQALSSATVALGEAHDTLWDSMLIEQKVGEAMLEAARGQGVAESRGAFEGVPGAFFYEVKSGKKAFLPRDGAIPKENGMLDELTFEVWREGGRHMSVVTYIKAPDPKR